MQILKKFDETVEHVKSACPILAIEKYINRRDTVCVQTYFNLCKQIGVKLDNEYWYNHVSKSQVMKLKLSYYGTNICERRRSDVSQRVGQNPTV